MDGRSPDYDRGRMLQARMSITVMRNVKFFFFFFFFFFKIILDSTPLRAYARFIYSILTRRLRLVSSLYLL